MVCRVEDDAFSSNLVPVMVLISSQCLSFIALFLSSVTSGMNVIHLLNISFIPVYTDAFLSILLAARVFCSPRISSSMSPEFTLVHSQLRNSWNLEFDSLMCCHRFWTIVNSLFICSSSFKQGAANSGSSKPVDLTLWSL